MLAVCRQAVLEFSHSFLSTAQYCTFYRWLLLFSCLLSRLLLRLPVGLCWLHPLLLAGAAYVTSRVSFMHQYTLLVHGP